MQPVDAFSPLLSRLPDKQARPLGFSLLAAGALAGMVGLAAVLFAQQAGGMQRYAYREIAGAALGLALPLFLGGAAASLPLRRTAQGAGMLGGALCLAGVAAFVWLYPFLWNVPGRDHSHWVVVTYALGLSWLIAALTSGLLTAYVDMRERRAGPAKEDDDVTDEEAMRDLLDATANSKLTWGGVRTDDRQILLSVDGYGSRLGGSLHRIGIRETIAGDGLGEDVGALMAFRGAKGTAQESYDDSQVNALTLLRARQRVAKPTWWQRFVAWWNA